MGRCSFRSKRGVIGSELWRRRGGTAHSGPVDAPDCWFRPIHRLPGNYGIDAGRFPASSRRRTRPSVRLRRCWNMAWRRGRAANASRETIVGFPQVGATVSREGPGPRRRPGRPGTGRPPRSGLSVGSAVRSWSRRSVDFGRLDQRGSHDRRRLPLHRCGSSAPVPRKARNGSHPAAPRPRRTAHAPHRNIASTSGIRRPVRTPGSQVGSSGPRSRDTKARGIEGRSAASRRGR